MFVFEDEKNYKPCKLKQYDAYVCMPPKGTIVINKLESLGGINVGKEYFTPEEQLKFNDSQKNMISSLINNSNALHFVSDKEPFVLAGTCGELSVISPSELAQNYNFLQSNQPVGINQQNLNQRMTGEYLKWTLVRLKPSMVNYMACRVPTSIRTNIQTKFGVGSINHQGVSHGKGDFVVCNKLPDGKPDFSTRFIVNGNVFASTFNNQGWQDSIKDTKTLNISNLPNLVPNDVVTEKPIDAKAFRDKCDTLMKELQKIYKFTVSSNNYELVKDYRGIAKEVTFKGDTYVAKFTVSGNFSHTYHGKNGDNEVKANETFVYFGCSTHQDSALFMSIHPKTDNIYLTGWTFPSKGSESKSGYDYPKSKTGGISSINCAEEAKYFLNNNKGADYFIDNRGTDKNKDEEDNGEPIDAKAFRDKCDTLMKELQKVFKFKVISNNYELVDNYTGLAHEFKFDGKTYVAKYIVGGEFTHTPSSGNEFKVDKTAVWFGCSAHHRDSALTISMHPDIDKLYLSGWTFPHKRHKYRTGDLYPHCTSGTILTMNCAEEVQMFVDGCKCCDYIDNRDAYNDTLVTIRDTVENRLKSGKYLPLSKDKSCDVTLEDGVLYFEYTCIRYHDSKKNKLDLVLRLGLGQSSDGVYKTVSKSNKKEIYDFIETFNDFRKRGYESSFRTPSCDASTFEAIKEFSKCGYKEMNAGLETNDFTKMDIDMYLKTVNLHSYLSRCRTKGVTLFRGASGFKNLNVGDRIPCNRFSSLTLDLRTAYNFGITVFIFEDVDIEGAYIISFSQYRDSEFEVLLNAGYDIVVKKFIGDRYCLCSLVKNNYKLNKADNFDDLEVLVMSALSSSKVIVDTYRIITNNGKGCFEFGLRETLGYTRIDLEINFTKKGISKLTVNAINIKAGNDKVSKLVDLGSSDLVDINSNDLIYNTVIPTIENYTLENCKGIEEPNNTFKYLSLLFYGVTLAFQREGYVILNSVFDKYDSWNKKDTYGGKLTINGDNDDKLVLSLKLDSENNFTISARSNNKKANKSVKFDGSDVDGLCNNVYNLVVKTFNLSQFNRVEKAVNLASKYLDCDNSLIQSQETSQLYKIGDKELLISVSFGKINLGGRLELNYFDNLRTIASGIINIVKE